MSSTAALPAPPSAPTGPERRDVLLAAGYGVLVVALPALGMGNGALLVDARPWPLEVSILLMLAGCASLLWRRSRPAVTLAVAGPLSVVELLLGGQISAYLLLFEALFEPVMHGSRRLAVLTTRLAVGGGVLGLLGALLSGASAQLVLAIALVGALVIATPLLWGWEVRHHRGAREAAERLARLEHELAAARADHTVETERRAIAHDLHDVIAGHLSAVSLHTGLAATLEDPAMRETSLRTARESAQAALRDLRSMIGVLSTAEAGTLPRATLDWPTLLERLRARDAEARVVVDPAVTDPGRVEPAVQAALLRLGAEAITNAVRHGTAPISLEITTDDGGVHLRLTNACRPGAVLGSGVGRGAIAHRAEAVGGSARSGLVEASGGGAWEVRAELPRRATTAPIAPQTEESLA